MIDFTLSEQQTGIRGLANSFAANVLTPAVATYENFPTQNQCFRSLRPFYRKAVEGGLIKAQIPVPLGGAGGALLDSAILVEEMYKSPGRSLALTNFGTGLGLSPLLLGGIPALHEKFLKPFLSGEGEPMASLVFSGPGGTANYLERGGKGLATTARKEGDSWIVNGEKVCSFLLDQHQLLILSRCGQRIVEVGMTVERISSVLSVDIRKKGNRKIQRQILRVLS